MEDAAREVEDQTDNIDKNYHQPNGKFAPGNPGRPIGAKSKSRTALNMFMDSQVENLEKWFAGLATDRERLECFIKLCAYRFPRLSSVAVKEDIEPRSVINYSRLSEATLKEILDNTIHETNH